MCPFLGRAIVLCATRSSQEGREEMNHYFDPYIIRDRNEQVRKEVRSLRLEERLRKNRAPGGSRMSSLVEWGRLLVGGAGSREMGRGARSRIGTVVAGMLLAGMLLTILVAWGAKPAGAAFPGTAGAIAFHSLRSGSAQIYRMDADGFGQTQLTTFDWNQEPAWSSDGKKIAFTSYHPNVGDIYIMDADGQNPVSLTMNSPADDCCPSWFPGTNKIAFQSVAGGSPQIFTMTFDSAGNPIQSTQLTNNASYNQLPAVSPDGKKIAFESNVGGDYEVWRMRSDGSNKVQLTNNSVDDFSPEWSPNGKRMAFNSLRTGDGEIFVMYADGTRQQNLTRKANTNDSGPAWSPDGKKIAFESFQTGSDVEIWRMRADGSNQVQLTDNTVADYSPSWQPIP
jgi:Tol biopolymer transport system component